MNLRDILALEVGAGLLLAKGKTLFAPKLVLENTQAKSIVHPGSSWLIVKLKIL
jgi:hypothetical protein